MKRENTLRQKAESLETLSEAVGAMKSLSAHQFRAAREALPAARAYREKIDEILSAIGVRQSTASGTARGVLLIASDLGLCGGYNSRLTEAAIARHRDLDASTLYCVGRRPRRILERAGLTIDRHYESPSGVSGLTELLLQLAEDVMDDYVDGAFGILEVVSARFDGVGAFTPIHTRVLPLETPVFRDPGSAERRVAYVTPYVSTDHLVAVAVREYLYIRLFQTALDALASEYSTRLVATESAGEWLSERIAVVRRQLSSIRREAATQEVLEIVSGARYRDRHLVH